MSQELSKVVEQLRNAAIALSMVCDYAFSQDGQGYNKGDTMFGHYVADVPVEYWSDELCAGVYWMLAKYRNQLAKLGVDYNKFPRPVVEGDRKELSSFARREIKKLGEKIEDEKRLNEYKKTGSFSVVKQTDYVVSGNMVCAMFKSPKDRNFIDKIKELPWKTRKWSGAEKAWIVDFDVCNYDNIVYIEEIIKEFGFICTNELSDSIEKLKTSKKTAKKKVNIYIQNKRIVADTDYDYNAVADMRNIFGRKWDSKRKVNTFPMTADASMAVVKLAKKYNWVVNEEVVNLSEKLTKKAGEMLEDSWAEKAELSIDGFGGGELKLRPFQAAGVKYVVKAERAFIADEMGLGKTLQALGAIEHKKAYPALIVVPAAVKLQWRNEVHKWVTGRSVQVVTGRNGCGYNSDIVVINYDILSYHVAGLSKINFRSMVLDEGHLIKNKKAKRSEAAKKLSKNVDFRMILTGTPILNKPAELINQLDFLGRLDEFGGFWQFVHRYCEATQERFGLDISGAANLDELSTRLRSSCYIRREKKQVAKELPEIQRSLVPLEINRKEYDIALSEIIKEIKERIRQLKAENREKEETDITYQSKANFNAIEILLRIEKLRQLVTKLKLNEAVAWVENFLDNTEEKLIVFAHHRDVQDALLDKLSKYNPAKIKGGDNETVRQNNVDKLWNDSSCRVMIASIQAANYGLNLQCASNVAFIEFGWHAAIMDQAEGRVHRIGTTAREINSWWLYAEDTIDRKIINLIESKRNISEAVNGKDEVKAEKILDWFMEEFVDNGRYK